MLTAFFASKWRWLLYAALVIFGVLLSTQLVDYATAWLARRHLNTEQQHATAAHAQQQAATTARYTGYRLDSVRRATQRQELLRQLHLSQQRDAQIDSQRPARVPLPAYRDLPRE